VLRSRWSRDTFTHDNLAHTHLVGFLTSVYRKEYHLWQLASCLLKLILISIPMFMSKNPIVQSLAVFITMLMYTFFILHLRPMQSSYLNKLEILSCIGVLVGAFTSVFFCCRIQRQSAVERLSKRFCRPPLRGYLRSVLFPFSTIDVSRFFAFASDAQNNVSEILDFGHQHSSWGSRNRGDVRSSCRNGV